jgi:predicted nucleic acid-binding protein
MILVDTSVWIDHLRNSEPVLAELLLQNQVLCHSFVRGELALGNLQQRNKILTALDDLPQAPLVFTEEVNIFIENHQLFGLGIGYVDAHLLASTRLLGNARVWTRDKRLLLVATKLKLAANVEALN